MQYTPRRLLSITIILISLTIGCTQERNKDIGTVITPEEDMIETLIIGPYRTDCVGAFPQECYLEYNEEAGKWHFFYDGIQGFDYEEGFIWTLKVSLHERPEEIQDVGRYEYRLVEVLKKEEASVDERPPRNPTTD